MKPSRFKKEASSTAGTDKSPKNLIVDDVDLASDDAASLHASLDACLSDVASNRSELETLLIDASVGRIIV